MPGDQAVMNWTWCIAVNSSITGIIVYRVTRENSQITNRVVLSMDGSKKVHYRQDNSRHELYTVEIEPSLQEKAVFTINNVSKLDDGEYSLHVRRVGYRDLHNEINVIVITDEPTVALRRLRATSRTQGKNFVHILLDEMQEAWKQSWKLRSGFPGA
ncbi:uncharacterized protein LOC114544638 [Dendronephthya gigantea]|uniref:uncharacterized protein LOC114544638 n=1 Tax=Dendronephthya gigantea TaxID=151771 RepID=UPI00106D12DA|nr:uncharacterized protein LOC114544638 [Dendronephthya gigantea]